MTRASPRGCDPERGKSADGAGAASHRDGTRKAVPGIGDRMAGFGIERSDRMSTTGFGVNREGLARFVLVGVRFR